MRRSCAVTTMKAMNDRGKTPGRIENPNDSRLARNVKFFGWRRTSQWRPDLQNACAVHCAARDELCATPANIIPAKVDRHSCSSERKRISDRRGEWNSTPSDQRINRKLVLVVLITRANHGRLITEPSFREIPVTSLKIKHVREIGFLIFVPLAEACLRCWPRGHPVRLRSAVGLRLLGSFRSPGGIGGPAHRSARPAASGKPGGLLNAHFSETRRADHPPASPGQGSDQLW